MKLTKAEIAGCKQRAKILLGYVDDAMDDQLNTMDPQNMTHWVRMEKEVYKQLKRLIK